MKKTLFILFYLMLFVGVGYAQESGIRFEQTREWKQIVKKAKKEKKMIFVDCYTDWCGPCRTMAANVFTQDTVGQFFNRHFVNAKFEMEKDADGILLKKQYRVEAFPTMLFIDPATGRELYRLIGIRTGQALLDYAGIALDSRRNLPGMAARYAAGDRTPEFLKEYQATLSDAGLPGSREMAMEYLRLLDVEQLATPYNWHMVVHYISDPLDKPLRLVMENRERFYALAGKEAVDFQLQGAIDNAVEEIISWRPEKGAFDSDRNERLIAYLKKTDDPLVPGALANLYTASCVRKKDYQALLATMREVFKYNLLRKDGEQKYLDTYVPVLGQCQDKSLLQSVIRLLDEKEESTPSFYGKARLMKWKSSLQKQTGDQQGAEASRLRAEEYQKQGDDAGEWM